MQLSEKQTSIIQEYNRNIKKSLSLFLLLLLSSISNTMEASNLSTCPTGTRLYVNKNITTSGDGTSWTTAYQELHEALDMAHDCPNIIEIWVAEGTYKPTTSLSNRIIFFIMKDNLALYGGFDGTETSLGDRDFEAHPTILSGDLMGNDDYSSIPITGNEENSYHVIFNFNNLIDSTAVLDGFHIVGGNANISPPNHVGGGLYNKQASPTVRNCKFYGNNAGYGGGGNYNDKSTISFTNCIFYTNTGAYRGGGMYNDDSTLDIINCTFFENHAVLPGMGVGGAMFNNFSNPTIVNSTYLNNTATHGGGALSNNAWAKPNIYNSIFWNNGDEIANTSADPNGGPPETNSNCTVTIQNCLLRNAIGSGANWNLFYGIDAGNNIDADPLFVNELLGDMHLQELSPALNVGDNLLLPPGLLIDLDGNPRIYNFVNGGNVDLGAFEFQFPTNCTIGAPCDDNDPCTTGEVIQDNCDCGGGSFLDNDNDNICDSDPADNCIGPNIGDACDDGNPNTVNDAVDASCQCVGVDPTFCPDLGLSIGDPCDDNDDCTVGETIQSDCMCGGGVLFDNDNDGWCDTNLNDNCVGPNIGDPCDDGDPCTLGEIIQSDCNCGGGSLFDVDNDLICDLDPIDNCLGPNIGAACDDNNICTVGETIQSDCNCGGGSLIDTDGDLVCDFDAADNCFGPNIGDTCDDGDACTTGEMIQADCNCGGGVLLDADGDLICDTDPADNCVGPNIGAACDDGDPCTTGETIQADCNCGSGVLLDTDGDLICDTDPMDNCIGPNVGDVCDDGDPNTLNDIVNSNCECDGITNAHDLEKDKFSIQVFPNPANDVLFVEIININGASGQAKIFNTIGQLVATKQIDATTNSPLYFEVENYQQGIYFIQVQLDNQKMVSRKFIVE